MRLPLLPESQVGDDRRDLYDAFRENVRTTFPDITTTTPDGALVGPWGVWMQVPTVGRAMMQLIRAIRELPGLPEDVRQLAILMTGARYRAAYEVYAHAPAARAAGLRDDQASTVLAGGRPVDLTPAQNAAADVASALLQGGVLPSPVYEHALNLLGREALDALVFTVSQYSFVGIMLNAYDVPAGAPA